MKTVRFPHEVRVCAWRGCRAEFRRKRYTNGRMEELEHFRRRRFCDRRCKGAAQTLRGRPRKCRHCRARLVRRSYQGATRPRLEPSVTWRKRRFCGVDCRREWCAGDLRGEARGGQKRAERPSPGRPTTKVCFHGVLRGKKCRWCERILSDGVTMTEKTRWRRPEAWAKLRGRAA